MAGIQGPNQLLDLLRALRRRRYQVAVPALLLASLGVAFAVMVPKQYRVTTRIEISDRTRVESDARLKNPQELAIRREAASASEHIRNYTRIKGVIEGSLARWPEYVMATSELERGQFIRQRILSNLSASPTSRDSKGGSIFIDIGFSDEDADRAVDFLRALTESWLWEMRETDRDTLITERAELQRIVDDQASDLAEKEDRLYALIELLGQDPTNPGKGNQREDRGDWTFKALEKAKTDLVEVEFQLGTTQFDLEQARARLQAEPEVLFESVPIPADDPVNEIRRLEAKKEQLEDRLAGLRPNNSTYRRLKPELDELIMEIEALRGKEPATSERWVEKPNERIEEYKVSVRTFEDLVGRLKEQRGALLAKIGDLEQETKARTGHYKRLEDLGNQVAEARTRLYETRAQYAERDKSLQMLDSSPTPWRITQPPVPNSAATTPNPFLLTAFAIFAGLALGVGTAVLSEYARSCYRSVGDLSAVMGVPILGSIDTIVTRSERRRMQASRAMAGLSTAVIVGTIGWITWLWHSSPERLPLELQDAIERLRSALK